MYSEYQAFLESEFAEDYWSDIGISHAAGLLARFSEQDWRRLETQWQLMSKIWKVRCAESIERPSQFASAILIGMLAEPDPAVVVAAADSLRSMEGAIPGLSVDTIRRIGALRDASGPGVKRVLEAFLKRVGS